MRSPSFHAFSVRGRDFLAAGTAPLPEGKSLLAEQANAAFLESVDAFGQAALAELARPDGDRKVIKANVVTHHRRRRAEIKRMAEAFGRGEVPETDRALLRFALEQSIATLDGIYKDFRRSVNIMHEKG